MDEICCTDLQVRRDIIMLPAVIVTVQFSCPECKLRNTFLITQIWKKFFNGIKLQYKWSEIDYEVNNILSISNENNVPLNKCFFSEHSSSSSSNLLEWKKMLKAGDLNFQFSVLNRYVANALFTFFSVFIRLICQ